MSKHGNIEHKTGELTTTQRAKQFLEHRNPSPTVGVYVLEKYRRWKYQSLIGNGGKKTHGRYKHSSKPKLHVPY
jgi:hypothetical protein